MTLSSKELGNHIRHLVIRYLSSLAMDLAKPLVRACAYVRWELEGELFKSNLILSKNRIDPIKKIFVDRIELCGAVINKRIKTLIEFQCRNVTPSSTHKLFMQ